MMYRSPERSKGLSLKAREIIRIWTKRKWNYSLILLVTIWLHILIIIIIIIIITTIIIIIIIINEIGIDKKQQLYIKQDVLKQTFPGQKLERKAVLDHV